ncbi:MAG: EVE domain-containing protein [Deltaproteobacteria bacterium]|nr:MAG: EVE domain-containing protein [Deltaproteobacteria bacterium]
MSIPLNDILALVGELDDTPGDDTPRERFRSFLRAQVREIGQLRDFIEACLRRSDEQGARALRDLVNHLGTFLGFETAFGRYRRIGTHPVLEGHWKSVDKGIHLAIEFKFDEADLTQTSSLIDAIEAAITEKRIPSWNNVIGLYVLREEEGSRPLAQALVTEHRNHQFRIVSIPALLSLAEFMAEYDIDHDDVMAILQPLNPSIEPTIALMTRLISEPRIAEPLAVEGGEGEAHYWLTPVYTDGPERVTDLVQTLLGKAKIYAIHERSPGRTRIKPGDEICFYVAQRGIVAHARVASSPERKTHRKIPHSKSYSWIFRLSDVEIYFDDPVVLDAALRRRLDAFRERDPDHAWFWFVQETRSLSAHDFALLTRRDAMK